MVRLKDIALRSGVSIMTVSKVLRDARDVSAQTKARIRRMAEEMGYVPDSRAQALRSRTIRLFGVVMPSASHPVASQVLSTIEDRAQELGIDLLFAQSLSSPEREEACLRRLLARRVDGVFIAPAYRLAPSAPIYGELLRAGLPVVLLGPPAPFCANFASITGDDAAGSFALTRHLIELGHRRIAFFAGPPAAPWAHARRAGYHRALREAGITDDDALIFAAGATIDDGRKAALQMLNEGASATAIQAVDDLVAIGAADMFLNQGWKIPEDVSLVGFGNMLLGEHFRVPLTTAGQPKFRLGLAAIEQMLELLRGSQPDSPTLPCELIIRASSGPPVR